MRGALARCGRTVRRHLLRDIRRRTARLAGAADPEAFGERVRRKLKRLGDRYTQRAAAV
ncbi:hypothetical protein [Streptomyces sp. NPDC047009]|uniref:hypothetical protein n=1 Tax=Streptomyces sp. NPDC047009 TaxID=3154496 RepID=UPI0033C98D2B